MPCPDEFLADATRYCLRSFLDDATRYTRVGDAMSGSNSVFIVSGTRLVPIAS
ncbi:hypothetical protein Hanom_Chr14g01286951 [Helianthus anomalus]